MAKFSYRKLAVASATAAFATSVPVFIFLLNYYILISSSSYISLLESRTATPQLAESAISSSQAAAVSSEVVSYVRGSSEKFASASYFTPEEVSHLADVRKLMRQVNIAFYAAAAVAAFSAFALFVLSGNLLAFFFAAKRAVLSSGIVTIAISAFLVAAASTQFGSLFTNFHLIFFPAGNWEFPANYLLVNLFTADFFAAFARDMVIGMLINGIALVIAALAFGYLREAVVNSRKLKVK